MERAATDEVSVAAVEVDVMDDPAMVAVKASELSWV